MLTRCFTQLFLRQGFILIVALFARINEIPIFHLLPNARCGTRHLGIVLDPSNFFAGWSEEVLTE